jgi:hypothetical protein
MISFKGMNKKRLHLAVKKLNLKLDAEGTRCDVVVQGAVNISASLVL